MPKRPPSDRTPAELREHYEVERELAERLRRADPQARKLLYSAAYDELFQRLPNHPQLKRKHDPSLARIGIASQLAILKRHIGPDSVYLEIGPGDCALTREVARYARQCIGVDVSTEISRKPDWPANLELIISDGTSIPVPDDSVDVAYSNQLMEHLHPDDASLQLANIYRSLRAGGVYICRTPSRFSGPHDISAYFDDEASGFHLREYGYGDLVPLFREAGFRHFNAFVVVRGRFVGHALAPMMAVEALLRRLPRGLAGEMARMRPIHLLLGVNLVAYK